VRYRTADIPALVRTPVGRRQLANGVLHRSWPLLRVAAAAQRATIGRWTRTVAVVGSLGKTTTVRALVAALTGELSPSVGENHYGFVAARILRTPPLAPYSVIEVGIDGPGQMSGYARMIRPDIVVVTSIASEHGRSLRTLEAARDEKAEMVRALPPDALAVLNGDDPNVRWMASETRARVVTFGLGPDNDVHATSVILDWPRGTRFTVELDCRAYPTWSRLIGAHMTYPVLATAAVVAAEGHDVAAALELLARLAPTPMRLEPVALPSGAFLLRDEFKSTLESVHAALDVLAEIPAHRRIVVMGDISEAPGRQASHADVGRRVAEIASVAVFVGDVSTGWVTGARRAGMPREALVRARSPVPLAIELLRSLVEQGDVILVKGRNPRRLERISLGLLGGPVVCDIELCYALTRCAECPMLARGWNGRRVVI
jgi:UDP-N-acetylmuramoyl-tripeptide--D-alanyl-D-alanine ligase